MQFEKNTSKDHDLPPPQECMLVLMWKTVTKWKMFQFCFPNNRYNTLIAYLLSQKKGALKIGRRKNIFKLKNYFISIISSSFTNKFWYIKGLTLPIWELGIYSFSQVAFSLKKILFPSNILYFIFFSIILKNNQKIFSLFPYSGRNVIQVTWPKSCNALTHLENNKFHSA